jgi:hypothetical protein
MVIDNGQKKKYNLPDFNFLNRNFFLFSFSSIIQYLILCLVFIGRFRAR